MVIWSFGIASVSVEEEAVLTGKRIVRASLVAAFSN
jgi:hypothetical protein